MATGNLKQLTLTEEQHQALAGLLAQVSVDAAPKPVPRARRPRPGASIKYLTQEEIDRLVAVIKAPRDKAIFTLAYHRGLRAGEIGRLQLSDLRLKEDRITINRLKGSASGEYHLCSSEVRALRAWLKVRGEAPGALFQSRRKAGISQQMLDVLMKRYGQLAGIPREKCHMHSLKHTCGTHLLERGESIEDVQDHLGHRNIQNTLIYAKFTNRRREERDRRLRDW